MLSKAQIIVIFSAAILLAAIYLLAPTVKPGRTIAPAAAAADSAALDFNRLKTAFEGTLSPQQQQYVRQLEEGVSRGDVRQQRISGYEALANFYADSASNPVLHFHYQAQAALLADNEKSLTFAAHSILGYLPYAHNEKEQHWLANLGRQLFEKAKAINAANDSTTIGLAGTYMYGAAAASGEAAMNGILQVREVVQRDSTNMFGQYMLGVGGMISGQYDRAAQRFEKVVAAQPSNVEVMFKLSEAYELSKQPKQAIRWYKEIKSRIPNPAMKQEIDKRIQQLESGTSPG